MAEGKAREQEATGFRLTEREESELRNPSEAHAKGDVFVPAHMPRLGQEMRDRLRKHVAPVDCA